MTTLVVSKCTVQCHRVHSLNCATITTIVSRTFSSCRNTQHPINNNSPCSAPLETTTLLSVSMHLIILCTPAKSLQLCLTLCNPMDCSLPGSSVRGILQAGILEWFAISSSRGSSEPGIKSSTLILIILWTSYK